MNLLRRGRMSLKGFKAGGDNKGKARSLPVLSYLGKAPTIHVAALVSPYAIVIGDVDIGEGASVFPGAVIRGDVAKIRIGRYANIQEQVVLHGGDLYDGDALRGHVPVAVGDYVTVAHGSVVHGSTIGDVSMIGIHATLYDGSTIGEGSIIGLHAAILANTAIPPRSIVVGVPGKVVRTVDDTTYSRLKQHALWYHELAASHRGTLF
jgi:carbonic anhydrase/acetyltransferase-like protein (isoleucine patch superfamily)